MILPDVQITKPNIERYLQKVGIQNVNIPLSLRSGIHKDKDQFYQINAKVNMFVDLDKHIKGINMSRFIRTISKHMTTVLNNQTIKNLLLALKESMDPCDNVYMEAFFNIPILKKSIVSDHVFPEFYRCGFEARLLKDSFHFFEIVYVPYTSYCPCSAALSKHSMETYNKQGFPHAQRSLATVIIETIPPDTIWLEDLIWLVEKAVVNIPYPIITRNDEQEIAIRAAEHPMFVEDVSREISNLLDLDTRIYDWLLKCEHFESIHTHEAVCVLNKGKNLSTNFNNMK